MEKVKASLKAKKKSPNKKKKKKKKKRGKVFTKARKLFNNLTKKMQISKLKKAMNKAVLAVKSIPFKGKSSALRNETLAGNHSNIKMGKHGVDWEYYERIAREQGIDKVPKEIRSEITGNAKIDKLADSTMADLAPFISTAKGIQQAITGKDLILNQKLSTKEQIAEGGGALASIIPIPGAKNVGKHVTKGIMERGEFTADVITNFANKIKGKVDEVPSKPSNLSKGLGDYGDDFVGTLKGEKVHLKDVKTKEIIYTKRSPEDTAKFRKEFDSTVRKGFLKGFANAPNKVEQLRKAGLTDIDIARMRDGLVPKGWQVHHKLPLDDGGTNALDNLVLIKNDPYHKAITNAQNDLTRGLEPGQNKTINWPIPDGDIYPPLKEW